MRSANKNRAQEQEMLAQANQQRKEVSATANMGAHVPVSPSCLDPAFIACKLLASPMDFTGRL